MFNHSMALLCIFHEFLYLSQDGVSMPGSNIPSEVSSVTIYTDVILLLPSTCNGVPYRLQDLVCFFIYFSALSINLKCYQKITPTSFSLASANSVLPI